MRKIAVVPVLILAVAVQAVPANADDKNVIAHSDGESDVTLHGSDRFGGDGPDLTDVETSSDRTETSTAYDDEVCPEPNKVYVEKYQRVGLDDPWLLASAGCGDAGSVPVRQVLTPDMVLEAVRTIGLPGGKFEVPPKTLVNYETTVYTEAAEFARTVTLLGYTVDVRARPSQFAWHFDDGEVDYTSTPGAPYPSDAVSHTWQDAHRTFRPWVDTTYSVSYRVDGGPWLDLGDTVTVDGQPTRVRVKEATPMLTGN